MKEYLFKTDVTMKDNNYWIDRDYISNKKILANNLSEALNKYVKLTEDYVSISKNAIKTKQPMYIDLKNGESVQIGYVVNGKTGLYNKNNKYIEKYVDLWIETIEIKYPFNTI